MEPVVTFLAGASSSEDSVLEDEVVFLFVMDSSLLHLFCQLRDLTIHCLEVLDNNLGVEFVCASVALAVFGTNFVPAFDLL